MRTNTAIALLLLVVVSFGIALAEDVAVSNYNWLQLPPGTVTPSIGSTINPSGAGGTGYGRPDYFRWGGRCWIPSNSLTSGGTADYWATLTFTQPRNVAKVKTSWWVAEGTQLKSFRIEGTTDGTTWVDIGGYDYGTFKTGDPLNPPDVSVTEGNYLGIRVRINSGQYVYGSSARGGPGLNGIEPISGASATVSTSEVNWAHKASFGTTASVSGMNQDSGTLFNNGQLIEQGRTGCKPGAWPDNAYAQIDLGAVRTIGAIVIAWNDVYYPFTLKVKTSLDGVNFTDVTNQSQRALYSDGFASRTTFDAVDARYVRLTNMLGTNYSLFTQVMVYTPLAASAVTVDAFSIADMTTGSTVFTNATLIDVTAYTASTTAEGADVNGYIITTTDFPPPTLASNATSAR